MVVVVKLSESRDISSWIIIRHLHQREVRQVRQSSFWDRAFLDFRCRGWPMKKFGEVVRHTLGRSLWDRGRRDLCRMGVLGVMTLRGWGATSIEDLWQVILLGGDWIAEAHQLRIVLWFVLGFPFYRHQFPGQLLRRDMSQSRRIRIRRRRVRDWRLR